MSYDEFMKNYGILSQSAGEPYPEPYEDEDEDDDDCVTADLYADGHALTFTLNNFEYTAYADNIADFKQEIFEQIEEIIDECIFESLQQVDEDEDAEG